MQSSAGVQMPTRPIASDGQERLLVVIRRRRALSPTSRRPRFVAGGEPISRRSPHI